MLTSASDNSGLTCTWEACEVSPGLNVALYGVALNIHNKTHVICRPVSNNIAQGIVYIYLGSGSIS